MSHAETKLVLAQLQEERERDAMLTGEVEQLKKANAVLRQQLREKDFTHNKTVRDYEEKLEVEQRKYADIAAVHNASNEGNERAFRRLHGENAELQARVAELEEQVLKKAKIEIVEREVLVLY